MYRRARTFRTDHILLFLLVVLSLCHGHIEPIVPKEGQEISLKKLRLEFSLKATEYSQYEIDHIELIFNNQNIYRKYVKQEPDVSSRLGPSGVYDITEPAQERFYTYSITSWKRLHAGPGDQQLTIRVYDESHRLLDERKINFTLKFKRPSPPGMPGGTVSYPERQSTSPGTQEKTEKCSSKCPVFLHPKDNEVIQRDNFYIAFGYPYRKSQQLFPEVILDNDPVEINFKKQGDIYIVLPKTQPALPDQKHSLEILLKNEFGTVLTSQSISFLSVRSLQKKRAADLSSQFAYHFSEKDKEEKKEEKSDLAHYGTAFTYNRAELLSDSNIFINEVGVHGTGTKSEIWDFDYNLQWTTEGTDREQTLNRYRVGLGYKNYLNVGLGDVYPYHNPFILNGPRIRGLEIKTGTGKKAINMDFVWGVSHHAIDQSKDTKAVANIKQLAVHDSTLLQDTLQYCRPGTYRRSILASRLHFGSGRNFNMGFSFLKARDNVNSIEPLYNGEQFIGETPKDNLVLGSDVMINVWERKVQIFGNLALSIFSNDITHSPSTLFDKPEQEKDKIEVLEKLEWLFVINSSVTPKPFNEEFEPDINNLWSGLAAETGVRLEVSDKKHISSSLLKYQRIGNVYRSLGNPYLTFDKKGFELSESYTYTPANMSARSSYTFFVDDVGEQKSSVKSTHNLSTSLSFNGTKRLPGFSATYSGNFLHTDPKETGSPGSGTSADTLTGQNPVNAYEISQNTSSNIAGLNTFYTVVLSGHSHNLNLGANLNTFSFRQKSDNTPTGSSLLRSEIDNSTLMYSGTLNSSIRNFPLSTRTGFSWSVPDGQNVLDVRSLNGGLTWNILKQFLRLDADLGYQMVEMNSEEASFLNEEYNWNAKVSLYLDRTHTFILNGRGNTRYVRRGENVGDKLPTYRILGNYEYNF
ncbi:hypothetical protein ACFL5V_06575 [Fibrobacterota bacterium]